MNKQRKSGRKELSNMSGRPLRRHERMIIGLTEGGGGYNMKYF